MASSRVLLLLIGVFSSHLPEVQVGSTTFWCNFQERGKMGQRNLEQLKTIMDDCVGSDTLPSPIQLPCVRLSVAEWANKTLQQKRAEVLGGLWMLQDGVQEVTSQTTLQCQSSLLRKMKRHVKNLLLIVKGIKIQNDTVIPSKSAVQHCTSQTSLEKVLEQYGKLVKGKLERLAMDLRDRVCTV